MIHRLHVAADFFSEFNPLLPKATGDIIYMAHLWQKDDRVSSRDPLFHASPKQLPASRPDVNCLTQTRPPGFAHMTGAVPKRAKASP